MKKKVGYVAINQVGLLVLCAGACILITLLIHLDPDGEYNGKHVATSDNTVTIILVDGLSKEVFLEELDSNYKGGHGGIHKDLLNVPYILFLPDHAPQTIDVARAEDIGATILQYIGGKVPYNLSGTSILERNN